MGRRDVRRMGVRSQVHYVRLYKIKEVNNRSNIVNRKRDKGKEDETFLRAKAGEEKRVKRRRRRDSL